MTSPEHTLVGIHTAFALGLHLRWSWTIIALAAIASNIPDLDGIPMLFDMQRFESWHRVVGHNFLMIAISSLLLAWTQWRFHWLELLGQKCKRYLPTLPSPVTPQPSTTNRLPHTASLVVLFGVAFLAQAIHLPCDMVVSGGSGLSHWYVYPFWPFYAEGFVFPMIPWGDVGPTLILMTGIMFVAKWPLRLRLWSSSTLLVLICYLLLRWNLSHLNA